MSSVSPRNRRRLTIGVRLTLLAAAATTGVCLLVCAILYTGLWFSLQHEVDAFLEGEVYELRGIIAEHPYDFAALQQEVRTEMGLRLRHDLSFRVLDSSGHIIVTSDATDQPTGFWLPPGMPPSSSDISFHTIRMRGSIAPVRACSQRFTAADHRVLIAQASYRLDQMMMSLARFRRVCIFALLVGGLAGLAGGRITARRSLHPLQVMIDKAQQISERRIDERLPTRGTNDEIDQLAETLNDMLDRVHGYVRRMQQFTADASHELRSPLAALRGNAEVVLTRPRTAEELRAAIEESIDHFSRLSRIAEDLLLLARLDAGEAVICREQLRLDLALADVVDLYAPLGGDRGIEIILRSSPPVTIDGDAGRIRQLVGNLLDNAIKFTTPPGRVEITMAQTDGQVRIAVRDTGIGIPPEEHERIFDRFYRVDRARSGQATRGAGLGLSICRSIVEAHGGRIAVDSAPGNGTTVTVTLPADVESAK